MTGRYGFNPSYRETLGYCLQDKRIQQKQTQHPADGEHRQTGNRAEVLFYHQCFGNIEQLTRQFKEVQKQNYNVLKPAFHLSLSLPPEEKISKSRFVDIAQDCAKALHFEQHQYVVVLHKDTAHPHIHLVVNRIGADKHVMDDSGILKLVDQFCREAELKYQLKQVESIRRYRSPEDRIKPSNDLRIVRLKSEIEQTLKVSHDLASFKDQMQERGYKVYKTERGISFKDDDGVFMTGSGADYPWRKIEATLTENLAERQAQVLRQQQELQQKLEREQEPEYELVQRRGLRMSM
jgi:hypothetical protein